MVNRVVLITGANRGLGLEIAKTLLEVGDYDVLLGCRTLAKGEEAQATLREHISSGQSSVKLIQIDVESDTSLDEAFTTITQNYQHLDVLVNNAGVGQVVSTIRCLLTYYEVHLDLAVQNDQYSDREGFSKMWNTNVVGAHVATLRFAPLLVKATSPRLLFITSGTSSLSQTGVHEGFIGHYNASPERGWPKHAIANPIMGYRTTKTGLNMLMTQWQRVLAADGVKVFAVAPGFLATRLMGISDQLLHDLGAVDPAVGARLVCDVIAGTRDDCSGRVVTKDGVQAW